ncbi:hypothetical protein MTO96_025152 [Rhipicephalus appendiculatus]
MPSNVELAKRIEQLEARTEGKLEEIASKLIQQCKPKLLAPQPEIPKLKAEVESLVLGVKGLNALVEELQAGHECQAKCSVCNGAHITGSVECKWKYRRAVGGQRERSLVRNTDISYSQGPHNINPRRSSASPSRGKNGKVGLPDTPSAHPGTGADNHRNKAKESSHPAARGHPPGKKDKDPNQVSWADIAASGLSTLADEKLKLENIRLRQELIELKCRRMKTIDSHKAFPTNAVDEAEMEEDVQYSTTQTGPNALAQSTLGTSAESKTGSDSGAIDEAKIEAIVMRCIKRVQADKERELQKVIERSVQAAIEENIRDTIERTIQAVLEPRLLMLQGLEVKLDRKLQEHDECTRAKVPKLSGRKTSKRTDRCDSWGTGEEPQDYNLQEQDG